MFVMCNVFIYVRFVLSELNVFIAVFYKLFLQNKCIRTFTFFSGAKYMATFEPRCICSVIFKFYNKGRLSNFSSVSKISVIVQIRGPFFVRVEKQPTLKWTIKQALKSNGSLSYTYMYVSIKILLVHSIFHPNQINISHFLSQNQCKK